MTAAAGGAGASPRVGPERRRSSHAPAAALGLAVGLLVGCGSDLEDFRVGPSDAGAPDGPDRDAPGGDVGGDAADAPPGDAADAGPGDAADAGSGDAADASTTDAGSLVACREIPLPCLDPSAADVLEVPSELDGATALATASPGQTIQLRGAALGSTWWLPPLVTLRGCDGAAIAGAVAFEGTGGVVEGFVVTGAIVANRTGAYIVRQNRFVGEARTGEAAVSARAIDGIVDAEVELLVEQNYFADRSAGVEASTRYDVGDRAVALTLRNNVFLGVDAPVDAWEGGLVGEITLTLEHNTFHVFATAVALTDLTPRAQLRANLFVEGDKAIGGASVYDAEYSMLWAVATPYDVAPLDGPLTTAESGFEDAAAGDFRLAPGSAALDVVPGATVGDDYYGCPRPAAPGGGPLYADVGAVEVQ